MIELLSITKSYHAPRIGYVPIIEIEKLIIRQGERLAITGPSGCGKSTLLHLIGGVLEPDSGSVRINGTDIAQFSEQQRDAYRARQVGYVFQDFHLIPSLTAEENIRLAISDRERPRRTVEDWLVRVGLNNRRHHKPVQLSRGEQQRVAIVRALIHQPDIVLADEPTGSLDYETAGAMMKLLLELCEENRQTLLCVTHDLPLAAMFPRQLSMLDYNELLKRRGTA